ncbi:hypothetical protein FX155_07035 [Acidaminococcus fermentans]|uniref:Uncharacterized protein n=1 Tax=Acidaminococcus fermentans TaxID=905 RepID=A0A6N7VZ54_ACIFE|nr:hypothetical protein [Acidaminococcus fermentans]MSS82345.1 hypothetical protein [Acidaminococcus fermentans]
MRKWGKWFTIGNYVWRACHDENSRGYMIPVDMGSHGLAQRIADSLNWQEEENQRQREIGMYNIYDEWYYMYGCLYRINTMCPLDYVLPLPKNFQGDEELIAEQIADDLNWMEEENEAEGDEEGYLPSPGGKRSYTGYRTTKGEPIFDRDIIFDTESGKRWEVHWIEPYRLESGRWYGIDEFGHALWLKILLEAHDDVEKREAQKEK